MHEAANPIIFIVSAATHVGQPFPHAATCAIAGSALGGSEMSDELSLSLGQRLLRFMLRIVPQHLLDEVLSEDGESSDARYQAERAARSARWPTT